MVRPEGLTLATLRSPPQSGLQGVRAAQTASYLQELSLAKRFHTFSQENSQVRTFLSQGEKPLFPALFQGWLLDGGGFGPGRGGEQALSRTGQGREQSLPGRGWGGL